MHSPQHNFTLVFTYMNMVCFYHVNVPYFRIFDLFTNKYTYLQVRIKSLSFIIHAIYDKISYAKLTHTFALILSRFFVTLIALISRYLNYFILIALMLQKYSIA